MSKLTVDKRVLDRPDLLTGYTAGTKNGWRTGYQSLWDVILTHRHYLLEEDPTPEFMTGYDVLMGAVKKEMELYGIKLPESGEGVLYFSENSSEGEKE